MYEIVPLFPLEENKCRLYSVFFFPFEKRTIPFVLLFAHHSINCAQGKSGLSLGWIQRQSMHCTKWVFCFFISDVSTYTSQMEDLSSICIISRIIRHDDLIYSLQINFFHLDSKNCVYAVWIAIWSWRKSKPSLLLVQRFSNIHFMQELHLISSKRWFNRMIIIRSTFVYFLIGTARKE